MLWKRWGHPTRSLTLFVSSQPRTDPCRPPNLPIPTTPRRAPAPSSPCCTPAYCTDTMARGPRCSIPPGPPAPPDSSRTPPTIGSDVRPARRPTRRPLPLSPPPPRRPWDLYPAASVSPPGRRSLSARTLAPAPMPPTSGVGILFTALCPPRPPLLRGTSVYWAAYGLGPMEPELFPPAPLCNLRPCI